MSIKNRQQAHHKIAQILALPYQGELQITINGTHRLGTRFNDCAISQNTLKVQTELELSLRLGQKKASASLNAVDDESAIKQTLEQLAITCKHMPDDKEMMPALGQVLKTKEHAFSQQTEALDIEDSGQWVATACQLGRKAGVDLAGLLEVSKNFTVYGDSLGGFAFERSHRVDYHVTATGNNGSGWAEVQGISLNEQQFIKATKQAIDKCHKAQNPRIYEPRPTTVILEPQAVGELLLMGFWYGFDQRATDEGRSAFADFNDRLGSLSLFSDPSYALFPALSFNDDGQSISKDSWLDQGKLEQLKTSRYWAKHKDIPVRSAPNNLILTGDNTTLEEMIKNTDDGILVTRFWYIRSTDEKTLGFTGMTRDGTFRIEKGKVTYPVVDMRWNESVIRVLKNITDSGVPTATGEYLPMVVPALKVEGFQFSSLSGEGKEPPNQ